MSISANVGSSTIVNPVDPPSGWTGIACPAPNEPQATGFQTSTAGPLFQPTLTTTEQFPYDPITVEAPADPASWSGGSTSETAGFYYIDASHPNASTSVTYGHPNQPLDPGNNWVRTFDLSGGTGKVVFAGGSYASGGANGIRPTFIGTATNPCHVEFRNGAQFTWNGEQTVWTLTHTIVSDFQMGGTRPKIIIQPGSTYWWFRGGGMVGTNPDGGGRAVQIGQQTPGTAQNQTSWWGFSDFECRNIGATPKDSSQDHAGFQIQYDWDHGWFVRCTGSFIRSDFIVTGDARNNHVDAADPSRNGHFMYSLDCTATECGEQGADHKSGYFVVFENLQSTNMDTQNADSGSNNDPVLVSNNNESDWNGPVLYYRCFARNFNAIGNGFRDSGSQIHAYSFVVASIVENVANGFSNDYGGFQDPSGGSERRRWEIVHCSGSDIGEFYEGVNGGGTAPRTDVYIAGNAVEITGTRAYWFRNLQTVDGRDNFVYNPSSTLTTDTDGVTPWQDSNQNLNVNPQFVDAGAGDYTPAAGSPLRNASQEEPFYAFWEGATFRNLRFDYNGNPRPASGAWDAGAIQVST